MDNNPLARNPSYVPAIVVVMSGMARGWVVKGVDARAPWRPPAETPMGMSLTDVEMGMRGRMTADVLDATIGACCTPTLRPVVAPARGSLVVPPAAVVEAVDAVALPADGAISGDVSDLGNVIIVGFYRIFVHGHLVYVAEVGIGGFVGTARELAGLPGRPAAWVASGGGGQGLVASAS